MMCLACATPAAGRLCRSCASTLRTVPERLVPPGVIVRSAFEHRDAARSLVHSMKYRPVVGTVMILAEAMADKVDHGDALVPIPRAAIRRWGTGIDPALELAVAVGRFTGIPVQRCLVAPLWWARHAGAGRSQRGAVPFRVRRRPEGWPVLVDDVLTTGRTIESAVLALQVLPALVVTATAAGRMSGG